MVGVIYDPCENGFTIVKLSNKFSAAVTSNINSNMNEDQKNVGRLIIPSSHILVIITSELNLKIFHDSLLPFIIFGEKI